MIVEPPGEPVIKKGAPSRVTNVGVMELSIRFIG